VMKAPIAKLMGTLAAPQSTFVRMLAAVQQHKTSG
jgi:hypothetical protein